MDYRRSLFQLEQWSPRLARHIWGLKSFLELPFTVALGLKVNLVSDGEVEVEIPFDPESQSTALLFAGEFAAKMIWQRHLRPNLDELKLSSIHGRFLKPVKSAVRVRTQLPEMERERVLRKLRLGESQEFDMGLIYIDNNDQQVASVNVIWSLRPTNPMALGPSQDRGDI
jgi:hypothetical protein